MAFRPCIDLRGGRVVQLVGGTLADDGGGTVVNYISELSAAEIAALYRQDGLRGGHVIMLGPGNEDAAREALAAYPGGLQVGGGVTPENASLWLDAGASHVIVTSWLFVGGAFSPERLKHLSRVVGRERLVVDFSCRLTTTGEYFVATDRWQTITATRVDAGTIHQIEPFCAELLVHAADVEGRCQGIDEDLVRLLGTCVTLPTTYAGGAKDVSDIRRVEQLSWSKIDLTIGSALDIFGGSLVRYADAAHLGRRTPDARVPDEGFPLTKTKEIKSLVKGFVRIQPQLARHKEGYSVGSKDREHLSYKDQHGEVVIYVDRGLRNYGLYPNTMRRLTAEGEESPLTAAEQSIILPRIVAGLTVLLESNTKIEVQ